LPKLHHFLPGSALIWIDPSAGHKKWLVIRKDCVVQLTGSHYFVSKGKQKDLYENSNPPRVKNADIYRTKS
jgi:hypothetical protein